MPALAPHSCWWIWKLRRSSAVAVSGGRSRKAAKRWTLRTYWCWVRGDRPRIIMSWSIRWRSGLIGADGLVAMASSSLKGPAWSDGGLSPPKTNDYHATSHPRDPPAERVRACLQNLNSLAYQDTATGLFPRAGRQGFRRRAHTRVEMLVMSVDRARIQSGTVAGITTPLARLKPNWLDVGKAKRSIRTARALVRSNLVVRSSLLPTATYLGRTGCGW